MLEQIALIREITEQIKTQGYRCDYDQRINLDLTIKQADLLLATLMTVLRDMRYDA
jgi:hypothetical protein